MKKAEFDIKEIVQIYNDELRSGTVLIAEGFEREHRKIIDVIKKYEKEFNTFGLISGRKCKSIGGRPTIEYLLNEGQTIFLGSLLKNTKVVVNFKLKLAHAFTAMKRMIEQQNKSRQDHEWIETRTSGKVIRRVATDTMKEFIDYCFARGSKNAQRYYVSITKMMNASLFIVEGKFDNLREWMNTEQLKVVAIVEKIIDNALRDGMQGELPYKNVFKLAKARVINFSDLYGKTTIISTQPKQLAMF